MIIRKPKTILLGIVVAGLTTWQPANAGFSLGDSVTMAGQPVFQLAAADGLTGQRRAWISQDALDNALIAASDRSPAAVQVGRENGAITLTLDGRRFATVDAASANNAGMPVEALAEKWAQSVRNFLSDSDRATLYTESLKNANQIKADIAVLERTFYAPAGLTFPITLSAAITTGTCQLGDPVEGVIDNDVLLGHYAIPAGSVVLGEVCLAPANETDSFSIRFHSLRTPNGTMLPIDAVCLSESLISCKGPHDVCTYALPSGMANGNPRVAGRIPAGIGVGALDTDGRNVLVFNKTTGTLAEGSPMFVQFETVSRVATITRQSM